MIKDSSIKKITVIGSGYVGTTTAAFFANAGYSVVALDIDEKKVHTINRGKSPFYEIGLDELITAGISKKTLKATSSYKEAIEDADIIISCVGTPDNPDGSSNLEYVFSAATLSSPFLKSGAIFVQKSTVPVGTGRKVIKLLPKNVCYVSNPEFLREGTAVYDTLLFDRIVVGGEIPSANEKILSLYRSIQKSSADISKISRGIAAKKIKNHSGDYISTTLESAELIKVTANAFLALKISFANSIAKLCDVTGADITGVMDGVGSDKRIGRAFLNAGRGYGGGCFPKDVSGLITSALEFGVDMSIMTAATDVNESMAGYIVQKAERELGSFENKKIAVLGLAFKSGTSDARKSPAVTIANLLAKSGAYVSAYDPQASMEAADSLTRTIYISQSINDSLSQAEAVFITTDWPEFITTSYNKHRNLKVIIDCMNCIKPNTLAKGITYIGVGK